MKSAPGGLVALLLLVACERAAAPPSTASRAPTPGKPIDMAALHQSGGVPPGWRFSVPPGDATAGRRAFVDLGCPSCHHVSGESFAGDRDPGTGPDLTGMGGHHPAEYFAESILNPDAVLVSGPGYLGPDGRSVMPTYPDLTLVQLADLVAYLKSLRAGAVAEMLTSPPVRPGGDVPPPPAHAASTFYVQVYDVQAGRLADFETWFRTEGLPAFLAVDGLLTVDTYVDVGRGGPALATVIGFRDLAAMKRFLEDPQDIALGTKFDEFIGPHQHRIFNRLPAYRVPSLSTP